MGFLIDFSCKVGETTNSEVNPLSAKITKCSNTLKQFVGNLPTNCLSVFDRFVGLAHKGLTSIFLIKILNK